MICRACAQDQPDEAMCHVHGEPINICRSCRSAQARQRRVCLENPAEQPGMHRCRVCDGEFSAGEMAFSRGVSRVCKACHATAQRVRHAARAAAERAGEAREPLSRRIDPCPICGVAQLAHWKCANCSSRGHALGRGVALPHLCGWCEEEALRGNSRRISAETP